MTFQPADWANSFDLTIDHTKIDSDLYAFPVTIHLSEHSGKNDFDARGIFDALEGGDNGIDEYTVLLFRPPTDSSGNQHTLKIDSSPTASMTFIEPGYGNFEMMFGFDGSDNASIRIGNTQELDFEGDFTIEFWMKSTNSSTFYAFSFGAYFGTGDENIALKFNDTYGVWLYWNGNGSAPLRLVSGSVGDYSDGVWRHFAVVRTNQYLKLYVNGTEIGREPAPVAIYTSGDSRNAYQMFGAHSTAQGVAINNLEGYMSGIRVSQIARYTSSGFDLPTGSFVNDEYTSLLIQDKMDYSGNQYNWYLYSNTSFYYGPSCTAEEPFGRAICFDGNATHMYTEDNLDNFNLGEGGEAFTIDFWMSGSVSDDYSGLCGLHGDAVHNIGGYQWFLGYSSSQLYFRWGDGATSYTERIANFVNTGWLWRNEWNHHAIINDPENNTFRFYFNGRLAASWTAITDIPIQPDVGTIKKCFTIGDIARNVWPGYKTFSEFRVSKGIARWQQEFRPPQAPYGSSSWHNRKKIAVTTTVSGVEEECFVEIARWHDGTYYKQFIAPGDDTGHIYHHATDYHKSDAQYNSYYATDRYTYTRSTQATQGQWLSLDYGAGNFPANPQKFNIDLGRPAVMTRLYIETGHDGSGGNTTSIKNCKVYGTNSSTAFDNVDYYDTTDLTLIGTFQARRRFDTSDQPDPQFFDLTTSGIAYRYYVVGVTDNFGAGYCTIRHIHYQSKIKEAQLFVKVPHISSVSGTKISIYYDNTKDDNNFYIGDTIEDIASYVWDENYLAVLHLDDVVYHYTSLATDNFLDSTSNDNHGTNANNLVRRYGNYHQEDVLFYGSDYITLGNLGSAAEGTVEFSSCSHIDKTATDNRNMFTTYYNGSNNAVRFEETIAGQLYVAVGISVGSMTSTSHTVSGTVDYNRISYAWSSTTGSGYGYYDDAYTWDSALPYIPTTFNNVSLGTGFNATDRWYLGMLDEFRISNIARSPSWLKATHYTMKDNLLTYETGQRAPYISYVCEGTVRDWSGYLADVPVRSYKRSNGRLIAETLSTASGTFQVLCDGQAEHYITALNPYTGVNAIIYDRVTPSGVIVYP